VGLDPVHASARRSFANAVRSASVADTLGGISRGEAERVWMAGRGRVTAPLVPAGLDALGVATQLMAPPPDAELLAAANRLVAAGVGPPSGSTGGPITGASGPAWGDISMTTGTFLSGAHDPEPRLLEIFLSAGVVAWGGEYSCDHHSEGSCSIYRVVWNVPAKKAKSVELWVPNEHTETGSGSGSKAYYHGAVEADVNSVGDLVYLRRTYQWRFPLSLADYSSQILLMSEDGTTKTSSFQAKTASDRPQWPEWWFDDLVLFETSRDLDPDGKDKVDDYRTLWYLDKPSSPPIKLLGPDDPDALFDGAGYSFGNPRVSPVNPNEFVTFGGDSAHQNGQPVPHVHSVTGNGLTTDQFRLKDGMESCQHPDFSPDGERVLCTRQSTVEDGASDGADEVRALFVYDRNDPHWSNQRELFTRIPLNDAGFPSTFQPSGASCDRLTYKHAHWCGTDDLLVADVFCTENPGNDATVDPNDWAVTASRTFLIDLSEGQTRYYDVTAAVEEKLGAAPGSLRSKFPTVRVLAWS